MTEEEKLVIAKELMGILPIHSGEILKDILKVIFRVDAEARRQTLDSLEDKRIAEKAEILAYFNTALDLGNEIISVLSEHLDFGTEEDPETPEETYLTGDFLITAMKVRGKWGWILDILTSSKTMEEISARIKEGEKERALNGAGK